MENLNFDLYWSRELDKHREDDFDEYEDVDYDYERRKEDE
jgi:hypothetical protein